LAAFMLHVNVTLGIYAEEMDRRDGEPERIRAIVQGRSTAGTEVGFASELAPGAPEEEARS
jgi:hypothetical protein